MSTALIEPAASAKSCSTDGVASPTPSLQQSRGIKFFGLKNLSSQDIKEVDPRSLPKIEYPPNKAAFRDWCNDVQTTHVFFNHTEGLVPSLRITKSNPPKYLWAVTADFDAPLSALEVAEGVAKRSAPGLLPRFSSVSYSGHARLTWEFEAPVFVDNEELAKRFMEILGKELRWNVLLPGLDEASYKLGQYYEAGQNWTEFPGSKPIPSDLLGLLFFRAAGQQKLSSDSPEIPIAEIAAEVERRWPGRVSGSFTVGARTPLFWIEPFEDRIGAQVGDYGMICYSTRAEKSFMSWSEILGRAFVRDFQAQRIGGSIEGVWFDNTHYWIKLENGFWAPNTKDDMGADLQVRYGLKPPEVKQALSVIRNTHRVFGVFPFIHNKNEIIRTQDGLYLNITHRKLVQPATDAGDCAWLDEFFEKIWDSKYPQQRDYFLSWFHHLYRTALEGNMRAGQAVLLAGPTGIGKTLISRKVVGAALGGFTDASSYLLGKTEFNKECAETAVWCVDDNRGASTWEKHDEFSNAIKRYVANPSIPYHPKYRDATTVPWLGRIMVTCNLDAKSLSILPEIDDSNEEKILLFKCGNWKPNFNKPDGIETHIAKTLPFFLRKLMEWKIPDHIKGDARFGIKHWHHPELVRESRSASAPGQLMELLPEVLKKCYPNDDKKPAEWMSAVRVRTLLDNDGFRSNLTKFSGNRLGIALSALPKHYVLETRWLHGTKEYLINLKP